MRKYQSSKGRTHLFPAKHSSLGKQEMWALIAADWPHGAEIVQPGNYMSAASSEKQLVQQSLLDGDSVVIEASQS
jgi:hypothetical protein